jgi:hypothetical protein
MKTAAPFGEPPEAAEKSVLKGFAISNITCYRAQHLPEKFRE